MVDLFEEALQVNNEITLILASGYNKRVRYAEPCYVLQSEVFYDSLFLLEQKK